MAISSKLKKTEMKGRAFSSGMKVRILLFLLRRSNIIGLRKEQPELIPGDPTGKDRARGYVVIVAQKWWVWPREFLRPLLNCRRLSG
ncbi:hypothetical protein Nepgr_008248 [Nepenthes gracilis]|uniref:Uncharacterized protein n=1 Tax=Nepenthes gracilis TaxID=150966 RepID=A0AAD3S8D3_NEPGR|nr:hypothetical protein Nepgr_008248 [Nepenthes gracilis]